MASKGRKTANSQGRRKGRITRSMANEASSEEAVTPQQSAELGEWWAKEDSVSRVPPLAGTPWTWASPLPLRASVSSSAQWLPGATVQ